MNGRVSLGRACLAFISCSIAVVFDARATDLAQSGSGANYFAAHFEFVSVPSGGFEPAVGRDVKIVIMDLLYEREGLNADESQPLAVVADPLFGGIVDYYIQAPDRPAGTWVWGNSFGVAPATRLLIQWSFDGVVPGGFPFIINNPIQPGPPPMAQIPVNWKRDRHPTLGAHVAAGGAYTIPADPPAIPAARTYLGVAPEALVHFAGVAPGFPLAELQAAFDFPQVVHGVKIFNMSFGGADSNSADAQNAILDEWALFADWFVRERDVVIVKSAGNNGAAVTLDESGQLSNATSKVTKLGDFYNGITVGASSSNFVARASYSSYWLGPDTGAAPDVRGKPDILAPGTDIWDGKSYTMDKNASGTSFAAPHVAGTAAILHRAIAGESHRAIKAIILNAARKRWITGLNDDNGFSLDAFATAIQASDQNYLDATGALQAAGAASAEWTPSQWNFNAGVFSAINPLDDEQGTGNLDVQRAVIQLNAGEYAAGTVPPIGWSRWQIIPPEGGSSVVDYLIDTPLKDKSFVTATLVWDRAIIEVNAGGAAGVVDETDVYLFGGLSHLDLELMKKNAATGEYAVVAKSVSTTDNVQHLHVPVAQGRYKLRVKWAGVTGVPDLTPIAVAWRAVAHCIGDHNGDGQVGFGDLTELLLHWGNCPPECPWDIAPPQGNGVVGFADLTQALIHWGACPPSAD